MQPLGYSNVPNAEFVRPCLAAKTTVLQLTSAQITCVDSVFSCQSCHCKPAQFNLGDIGTSESFIPLTADL